MSRVMHNIQGKKSILDFFFVIVVVKLMAGQVAKTHYV